MQGQSKFQKILCFPRSFIANLQNDRVYKSLFWGILILALISRLFFLSDKPFHHDESLHAYYSHRVSQGFVHEYSALLHGPFLYYFVGFIQFVAGVFSLEWQTSDFVARFPAALFGVLVVISPFALSRFLGKTAACVFACLLLISPTFWYFGRFLREDIFCAMWVLGIFGGYLAYLRTPEPENLQQVPYDKKSLALVFSIAMLAFHFTNKENAYLHLGIWLLGLMSIWFFKTYWISDASLYSIQNSQLFLKSEKEQRQVIFSRFLLSALVFVSIYVLFYTSFLRHSNLLQALKNALWQESLGYWWDQNQKRRIDGPFDYYWPLLANYEFLLFPLVALAWVRVLGLSRKFNDLPAYVKNILTYKKVFYFTITFLSLVLLSVIFIPRIGLVSESCSYVDFCSSGLPSVGIECKADSGRPLQCLLHISHSRHLLQIIAYLVFGGVAFVSSMHALKFIDAFLWFWLTGALGAYSYVGEKVPWLVIYVLIPLLLLAGLELSRLLLRKELPLYPCLDHNFLGIERVFFKKITKVALPWIGLWFVIALPFTLWKGVRVAWVRPADPAERLVFTQTTPAIKAIVERWQEAEQAYLKQNLPRRLIDLRLGVHGDATWPIAWYIQPFITNKDAQVHQNVFLADESLRQLVFEEKKIDAFLANESFLPEILQRLPDYDVFYVPLRAWWVPHPDPSLKQILGYFFTGIPYGHKVYNPRYSLDSSQPQWVYPQDWRGDGNPRQNGTGSTNVIYAERRSKESKLSVLPSWEPDVSLGVQVKQRAQE